MALPKLSQPIFSLNLPSTGQTIRYRPFTVREEKLLLIAQESKERQDIVNVYKQLINNCSIDPIDVDNLASFDIEYFFICLRSKSVSNVSKVRIKDPDDGITYDVELNLDKVEIVRSGADDLVSNKVQLTDDVAIVLQYPTFDTLSKANSDNQVQNTLTVLRECIKQIEEKDTVHEMSAYSKEEKDEFVLSLNKNQMESIQRFFESMPKIVVRSKYVTENKQVKDVTVEGLENFF